MSKMILRLSRRWIGIGAHVLLSVLPLTAEVSLPWIAGAGLHITTGDYGTDTNTTTTYMPFSFGRQFTSGKLDLVVPFLRVKSAENVTIIGGRPQGTGRFRSGGQTRTESGLGDMLLRGRLNVYEERDNDYFPSTTLVARIKFPTADEDDGLGTGEFDETIGVEFWKTVHGPWAALFDFTYTWTGNPPGIELRNPWAFALGVGYTFRERFMATMTYEESRALVRGNSNPRDWVFGLSFMPNKVVSLSSSIQFGLSDGSPDFGIGFQGNYRFAL
jgi:hypothetical protein